MSFIIIAYIINLLALVIILIDKDFALSIGIRTRGDLVKNIILVLIPGINIFAALCFIGEYSFYIYPTINKIIRDVLDKEL